MTREQEGSLLPREADEHLDRLLARWADHRQLSAAQAEAIRQAVVGAPTELPYGWWQGFQAHMDVALARAARASRVNPTFWHRINPLLAPGASEPCTTIPSYQAYLRLA